MSKFRDNNFADPDLSKKTYFIILTFSFIWLIMIFLAPVLMHYGGIFETVSSFFYIFFSKVCHQQDNRSFHVFRS